MDAHIRRRNHGKAVVLAQKPLKAVWLNQLAPGRCKDVPDFFTIRWFHVQVQGHNFASRQLLPHMLYFWLLETSPWL